MFRERLNLEFAARKQANPRYSLRAFAAFIETDHSTISKILSGSRKVTSRQLRTIGKKLGMSAEEITVYLAAEHVPDTASAKRQAMLTHWTAEALAVVSGRLHWAIVQASRRPEFRMDCRWLAAELRTTADEINLALTRLLRLELIDARWQDRTGSAALSECEFRKLALTRIRKKAAEDHVTIGSD